MRESQHSSSALGSLTSLFGGRESRFLWLTDGRLDVSDDHIDTLDSHLIELEIVRREAIVGDDDVRVLLCRLDVLLESRLGLVFVCLEQIGQGDLMVWLTLRVLQDSTRQPHIVISVDEDRQVKCLSELLTAENEGTLDDNDVAWLHVLLRLQPDLVEFVVDGEVEWLPVTQLLDSANKQFEVDLLRVVEVGRLVNRIDLSKHLLFTLILFFDKRTGTTPLLADVSTNGSIKVDKTDDGSADVALR